jgi:hypothetical protein
VALEQLEVLGLAERSPHELSHGERLLHHAALGTLIEVAPAASPPALRHPDNLSSLETTV